MRFAISIPQLYADGEFDPTAFRNYCAGVEQLGYHSAWAHESLLSASPQLSPVEMMTYAAACTQRLRLGCAVFVSTLHSPVHLARSMATLDQLSGGRVTAGVGLGFGTTSYPTFGLDTARPVARFRESLRVLRALWGEEKVDLQGDFWQLNGVAMEPKPF